MNMAKKFVFALVLILLCLPSAANAQNATKTETKVAIFAGGCFWCMQPPYDHTKGVVKTVVGYTGGSEADANYEKVSAHKTQHRESIQVTYDPAIVSYDQLLDVFWRQINPTQADGQFSDIGLSYQTVSTTEPMRKKKPPRTQRRNSGRAANFRNRS